MQERESLRRGGEGGGGQSGKEGLPLRILVQLDRITLDQLRHQRGTINLIWMMINVSWYIRWGARLKSNGSQLYLSFVKIYIFYSMMRKKKVRNSRFPRFKFPETSSKRAKPSYFLKLSLKRRRTSRFIVFPLRSDVIRARSYFLSRLIGNWN